MPDIRAELVKTGKRRASLRARLDVEEQRLRELIVLGCAEGLSVVEVCRLGRVSRETAHKVLRRSQ